MSALVSRILLVVDSDASDLFQTSLLLQRLNYTICTATTAKEALEMASVAVPSLFLISRSLNDMDGLGLVTMIKQDARTRMVPVIMQTPGNRANENRVLQERGCTACISKPVKADELYRAVQAAIEPTPRRNIRILTRLPVTVNDTPLDIKAGECVSVLSEHGMYLRTLKPFPVHTKVHAAISVEGRMISVDGEVLYCHGSGEGPFKEPGMGLRFTRIASQDQEFIGKFINNELTRGINTRI